MMRMSDLALADKAAIIARHPAVFRRDWGRLTRNCGLLASLIGVLTAGVLFLEVSPGQLFEGTGKLGRIVVIMMPPTFGTTERLLVWVRAIGETLSIAFLGTLVAATLAFPVGFLAARNVLPIFLVRFLLRRTFDTIRAIDQLIWALIWINVVGLGPFAGILAIMTSDFGAFGKLFSEAIEAADRRAREGVTATGGTPLDTVRFGLLPEILPVIASQVLYFFESNVRSSTIIGIVGAGGIGLMLFEAIQTYEWQRVSFIIGMILIVVAAIDLVSEQLRKRLIY